MCLDPEDSWFFQEFCQEDEFVLQEEDHLPPGDCCGSTEPFQEVHFRNALIDMRERKSPLEDYPNIEDIKSEPLIYPKEVKERKRYFSWSIATKFESEDKLLKFEEKIEVLCNKAILVLNPALGEVLGYLNFSLEQSREGFHSFFPGFKFVPARGGCNNNADLFLDYLKKNPTSRTVMCLGFSPEVFNVLTQY